MSDYFWLQGLLPTKFPNCHVLTFGYNDDIESAADALLGDLVDYMFNTELRVRSLSFPHTRSRI
jgi:hypothetical protein